MESSIHPDRTVPTLNWHAMKSRRTPPITYQLIIDVSQPLTCVVGRLGEFAFPAGRYVYTGSARRALEARVARHCSKGGKTLRWHIDYLLEAPGASVVEVVRSVRAECVLNKGVGGSVLIAGFGASDCRAGCGSHLKYLGRC